MNPGTGFVAAIGQHEMEQNDQATPERNLKDPLHF